MDQLPGEGRGHSPPPDNLPDHEKPAGHISVRVSQPELLYQLAKGRTLSAQDFFVTISQTRIGDPFLTQEETGDSGKS